MASDPEQSVQTLIAFIDTKTSTLHLLSEKQLKDWRHNHQKKNCTAPTSVIESALGRSICLQNLPHLLRTAYHKFMITRTIINNILTQLENAKFPDIEQSSQAAFRQKFLLVTTPFKESKLSAAKSSAAAKATTPAPTLTQFLVAPESSASAAATATSSAPALILSVTKEKVHAIGKLLTKPRDSPAKRPRADSPDSNSSSPATTSKPATFLTTESITAPRKALTFAPPTQTPPSVTFHEGPPPTLTATQPEAARPPVASTTKKISISQAIPGLPGISRDFQGFNPNPVNSQITITRVPAKNPLPQQPPLEQRAKIQLPPNFNPPPQPAKSSIPPAEPNPPPSKPRTAPTPPLPTFNPNLKKYEREYSRQQRYLNHKAVLECHTDNNTTPSCLEPGRWRIPPNMFNDPELQAAITKSVQKAYIQTTLTYISKRTLTIDSALRHIEQTNNADSIASIKANVEKSLDNPLKKSWQKIEKIVLAKTKPAPKPAPPQAKKVIPALMSLTFNPFVVLRFNTPSKACNVGLTNPNPSPNPNPNPNPNLTLTKASTETLPTTSKASNLNNIASIITGPTVLTTIEEEPTTEEAAPMEVTPTEPTTTATTSSSSTPAILTTTNSQVNQK